MKAKVEDVHDSHGLVFTLNLKKSGSSDDTVVNFLNKKLKPLIVGEHASTLYVSRIVLTPQGISLTLVEQHKDLAKVDYHRNSDRKDNKYTVLIIEVEPEKVPVG
jgi:hypothetical protein